MIQSKKSKLPLGQSFPIPRNFYRRDLRRIKMLLKKGSCRHNFLNVLLILL